MRIVTQPVGRAAGILTGLLAASLCIGIGPSALAAPFPGWGDPSDERSEGSASEEQASSPDTTSGHAGRNSAHPAAGSGSGAAFEPALSRAIDAAISALAKMTGEHPHAPLLTAVLHRRFGVDAFATAAADYDAADDLTLFVFRRMLDATHTVTRNDLDSLIVNVNRLTGPALHCDRVALPKDYALRLHLGTAQGGYYVTHVGLSLLWLDELGCQSPAQPGLREEVVGAMADLVNEATYVGDLQLESAAFLHAMGDGDRISNAFVTKAIRAQYVTGTWGSSVGDPAPAWHPTGMGLWFLLEVRDDPLGPVLP